MLEIEAKFDVLSGREKNGTLIIPLLVRGFYGELTICFGDDSPLAQAVLKEWQKEAKPS